MWFALRGILRWGSGVSLLGVRRFLLLFEVAFQSHNPAPCRFHFTDILLLTIGFKNLFALIVIFDCHTMTLGIISLWPSLPLFQKNTPFEK